MDIQQFAQGTRFFKGKVDFQEDGCWIWKGDVDADGSGYFTSRGRTIIAHHYSFEFFSGPARAGSDIIQTCANRRCVNPDHLAEHAIGDDHMLEASTGGDLRATSVSALGGPTY